MIFLGAVLSLFPYFLGTLTSAVSSGDFGLAISSVLFLSDVLTQPTPPLLHRGPNLTPVKQAARKFRPELEIEIKA